MRHAIAAAQQVADAVACAIRQSRPSRRCASATCLAAPWRGIPGFRRHFLYSLSDKHNNFIASRFVASAIGADLTEHQPSTAWSTARMPVESSSSIGVSSVAAGSRITALGTEAADGNSICLTCRCTSVTPRWERTRPPTASSARRPCAAPCGSALQALASLLALPRTPASAESAVHVARTAPERKQHHLGGVDHRAAAHRDDEIGLRRRAAPPPRRSRPSRGLCAEIASNFPANFAPRLRMTRATRGPLAIERVVVTKTFRAPARPISSASASAAGLP